MRAPRRARDTMNSAELPGTGIRAPALLRVRTVWLAPIAVTAILMFFMTLFYIGAIVNPAGHLSGLPVALVNEDSGATLHGSQVNFGAEAASDLLHASGVTSRLSLDEVSYARAEAQLSSGNAYAAIVIPPGFTASLLSAYGLSPASAGPPAIQLLTSPRAGSMGVQLATGVAQPALRQVSSAVGSKLSSEAARLGSAPRSGVGTASPITVTTSDFRPVPPDSALGLSAFYIALLALMCGFLGAVLVNSSIDAALGYSTSEIGPRWRQRMPAAISRWQTLLTKWSVALVAVPTLTGILLLVAAGLLHVNTPHPGELWLFTSLAGIAIAAGTLTLLGGVRAILYFHAQADAGLTRGAVLTTAGLIFWLITGAAVTRWYDRKGMNRLPPDVPEFTQRSAPAYTAAVLACWPRHRVPACRLASPRCGTAGRGRERAESHAPAV